MPASAEGQWYRRWYTRGPDSALHGVFHNSNTKFHNITTLSLGSVALVQPEPAYRQHTVTVEMVTNGIFSNVAWPGAQVNANESGTIPGGATIGIHGLWESPLVGQQVLIGFVDGSHGNPVVVQKYPYNALARPDLEALHVLPLTAKSHGPTDVVLGHHTGSYIALRGTVPLPAEIDIFSYSVITITASAFMNINVTSTLSISSNGAMTIKGSTITIPTSVSTVTIGAGTEAVLKGATTRIEHAKLESILNAMLGVINGAPLNQPGGAPSVLQAALAAAVTGLPVPSYPTSLLSSRLLAD